METLIANWKTYFRYCFPSRIRKFPRIPLTDHFWDFFHAGRQLAELHLHYDQQPEYPLDLIHDGKIDWELKDKMRLSKDKTQISYNYSLTLNGIPAKTFNYRLGNRSALEWIIERYQIKTDERSQITNNPNQPYEPKAIIKLIGQIITVSLKTVEIVEKLPIIQQV
ncbi:MAG: hypothetical protein BWK79_15910 [Beggiatoa sp. IS2]|nr:MAG: hypothetical protein BWK79_15910 [Beggiatoa sp. IS2]